MADLFNYKNKRINFIPKLRKEEYGTGEKDKFGRPVPNWDLLIDADDDGFDKNHREPNGLFRMKVILPKHTMLIRYGSEIGSFTAPKGTLYEELSLPYDKESVFYHEYEVIADSIKVIALKKCVVDRGKVAPGFDFPGGGIQYLHPYNMIRSINLNLLKEVLL